MDRLPKNPDIKSIEDLLTIKKTEYLQAIKSGATHDELKKIFLDIKKLNQLKDLNNVASGQPIPTLYVSNT
ncbi:MAG TPA: hypothetical protein VF008_23085 [Niastella sp.]